ncbi:hypothetical protein GCM10027161_44730 [Microbispora hainanensis]
MLAQHAPLWILGNLTVHLISGPLCSAPALLCEVTTKTRRFRALHPATPVSHSVKLRALRVYMGPESGTKGGRLFDESDGA